MCGDIRKQTRKSLFVLPFDLDHQNRLPIDDVRVLTIDVVGLKMKLQFFYVSVNFLVDRVRPYFQAHRILRSSKVRFSSLFYSCGSNTRCDRRNTANRHACSLICERLKAPGARKNTYEPTTSPHDTIENTRNNDEHETPLRIDVRATIVLPLAHYEMVPRRESSFETDPLYRS